jgi:hypothetical protein
VLYHHLVASLRPGGVLFMGGTEMVSAAHQLGLTPIGPSFYRKDEVGATAPRTFARPAVSACPALVQTPLSRVPVGTR